VPQLILINGDEDFLKERAVKDEVSCSLLESSEYDASINLNQYLDDISIKPFNHSSHVFILWNAKEIPVQLPAGESDILIIISTPKIKLTDSRAKRIHNFSKLKAYDDKNEYLPWIIKEGERLNIDLSCVASALFVSSGKSLRKISSEIMKLSVIASAGVITPADAKSVLCFSADLTPKEVIDSICEGHPAKALAYLDALQERMDETGWILAYLQRHVIQQLRMEYAASHGISQTEIAKLLNIHPFVCKKMFESRLGLWTMDSLITSYNMLCDLDILHKRGDGSARTGLEIEIIRLSEEAKNVKRIRRS
jgi:DNA polymerase III delta subunit